VVTSHPVCFVDGERHADYRPVQTAYRLQISRQNAINFSHLLHVIKDRLYGMIEMPDCIIA
jgi:hypothetical protein